MTRLLPNDGNFPPAGGPSDGINDEERAPRAVSRFVAAHTSAPIARVSGLDELQEISCGVQFGDPSLQRDPARAPVRR